MIKRKERRLNRRPVTIDTLEERRLFALAVGLTSANELVTFDTATPGTATAPVAVTGLGGSEDLVAIDFRPATGQLYGLGDTGQLYTIDPTTGAATTLGTPLTLGAGTSFSIDFNPSSGALRVVSDADLNLRITAATGAVAGTDSAQAYDAADDNTGANPNIAAAGYDNNFASTGATTLFVIDTTLDVLATQGSRAGTTPVVSPNTGTLFTVGELGVDVNNLGGFDVAEADGVAYAAFGTAGGGGGGGGGSPSTLYTVNLNTGAATSVGAIGTGLVLTDLSVAPVQRTLFALGSNGTSFVTFNTGNLATNPTPVNITGLDGADVLSSIDFRPANGQLFGSTPDGQIYTINPTTGAATLLGTGIDPALTGDVADIDFNPTVDRLRVVTTGDANARVNPDTGLLVDGDTVTAGAQPDTALAFAGTDANNGEDPAVVAAAYTNSAPGSVATSLFAIEAGNDALVSIGSVQGATPTVSPNGGQLFTVGLLGVDVVSAGFDIANDGPALALINAQGGTGTQLYSINTTTGAATLIGTVGDGTSTFGDLAIGYTLFTLTPATQNVAENAGTATVTVTRSGVTTGAATVNFSATNAVILDNPFGSADVGNDYGVAAQDDFTGTVSFADGETSKTIDIPILNDTTDEADETFNVTLSNASAGEVGAEVAVTITDDDAAPVVSIADASVNEGDTGTSTGSLTVTLSAASGQPVTVDVAEATGTGVGTATAGTDYVALTATTLTFAPGETSKTVDITVNGDVTGEPAETVNVVLSNPQGATLATDATGTLTITSDDANATVGADPVRTTGKATQLLTITGSGGNDLIEVQQAGANVTVTLNGQALGTATPRKGLYRIAIYGGAGNDTIRINSKLAFPAEIHGQDGDDLLIGGKNRDLLIGGDGVDALIGGGGEDILIGGISDYTSNPLATATLLNAFIAKGSFTDRAALMTSGVGGFSFSSTTIDDDNDVDYLAGAGTNDLFYRDTGDSIVDEVAKGSVQDI